MGDFTMPSLGAGMTVGRVVEWLVEPGDSVRRGDLIAVVETDKADIEVEVWEDGTVAELLVEEGTKVPVGTPLARLVGADEPAATGDVDAPPDTDADAEPVPAAAPNREPVRVEAAAAPGPRTRRPNVRGPLARHRAEELHVDLARVRGSGPGGVILRHDVEDAAGTSTRRRRVTPYARQLARDAGLDPQQLTGSGPAGAVLGRDVEQAGTTTPSRAAAAAAPAAVRGAGAPDPMRAAIARAMSQSNREIPHYYLGTTVDVTDSLAWLTQYNADRPPAERVLLAAVQLRAVALALREHPELNGHWIDDRFVPASSVDLCVAVALRGGGLLTPAIPAADTLGLDELMARLRDLVRRTRSGGLRGREMAGGSATVTNLGDLGVDTVYGVISPPQIVLVGFGRPVQRPWVVDGEVVARDLVTVTLAADHRQSDGLSGSRFLATVTDHLEHPEET